MSQEENTSNMSASRGERMDDGMEKSASESAGIPPPPPSNDAANVQPPLSLHRGHNRKQSTESLISEVTMEGSPKGFSWDSKKVAADIDQVSKEEDATKALADPSCIITLSQISKTCPVEEEAEKLILKALDEKERPIMGSSILPQVPDDSAQAFETTPTAANPANSGTSNGWDSANQTPVIHTSSTPSLHTSVPSSHARAHSSAATANPESSRLGIMGMFHRKRTKETDQFSPLFSAMLPTVHEENATPKSNADALMKNANMLFRRSTRSSNNSNHSGDIEQGSVYDSDPSGKSKSNDPNVAMQQMAKQAERNMQNEVSIFDGFLQPRKKTIGTTIKNELFYLIFPLVIVASILFYGAENPELGNSGASVSYFLLFLVRNVVTYTLGKGTSIYCISYLSLKRRFTVKVSPVSGVAGGLLEGFWTFRVLAAVLTAKAALVASSHIILCLLAVS